MAARQGGNSDDVAMLFLSFFEFTWPLAIFYICFQVKKVRKA